MVNQTGGVALEDEVIHGENMQASFTADFKLWILCFIANSFLNFATFLILIYALL